MAFDALKKLPVRSFSAWFSELASLAQKADDISSLPGLELLLRNGRSLTGIVLRLEETDHYPTIMLVSTEGDQRVTFVSVHDVSALAVPEPDKFMKLFAPPVFSKELTTIELKRKAKAAEQAVKEVTSFDIPVVVEENTVHEEGRGAVAVTLDLLKEVFTDICSDDLGMSTVQELVKTIVISGSSRPHISLQDGKLQIAVTKEITRPVAQEKERLVKEIQGVL